MAQVEVETLPARRRFTRTEYHRMAEVGILRRGERVELIRGAIVQMSPIGSRHKAFVDNLTQLLVVRLAGRAIVSVQSGVVLSEDTEPEPDLKILRPRTAVPYKDAEATGEDTVLLIEVADSSLAYDRTLKRDLYAGAGIPEYWVVDCPAEAVHVYRAPSPEGYRDVTTVAAAASVSPLAFPDVSLALAEIFA
jgi:Uma2 family endonuclease